MQGVLDTIKKNRGVQQADMLELHAKEVVALESQGKNIAQISGGPGRGIYQYEMFDQGGSGAAKDALVRYKRFYSKDGYGGTMPKEFKEELNQIDEDNPDFTKLSPELQTDIFYADKEQKGGFPLDKLGTPEFSHKDAWLKSHWGGSTKDLPAKSNYYDATINNMMNNEQEKNDEKLYNKIKQEISQEIGTKFSINNIMEDLGQVFETFE
tara:strand:+ start:632 stop:1261 length:630 start_codon:yes stop_codon:yes gene_type:complete